MTSPTPPTPHVRGGLIVGSAQLRSHALTSGLHLSACTMQASGAPARRGVLATSSASSSSVEVVVVQRHAVGAPLAAPAVASPNANVDAADATAKRPRTTTTTNADQAQHPYVLPHDIDHVAIWRGLHAERVACVVGFCSVGTLKPDVIRAGDIALPDDWFAPHQRALFVEPTPAAHYRPEIHAAFRAHVLRHLLADSAVAPFTYSGSAVYAQTFGPRFETKAEVRALARDADVVGMTGAHEAGLACELRIPYVMVCVADNIAHGLSSNDDAISDLAKFRRAQEANAARVDRVLSLAVQAAASFARGESLPPIPHSPSPYAVATLIRARYLATANAKDEVIHKAIVAISDAGEIVGIHSEAEAAPIPPYQARVVHHLGPESLLIPGFVNAHTHAPMTLMRGFGDDMRLTDWLVTRIWPAEAQCVSPAYVSDGARVAVHEMLLSGTTCFSDMYFFPKDVARVVEEAGLRAVLGEIVIHFPTPYTTGPQDCLSKAEAALKAHATDVADRSARRMAPPLVTPAVTPHAPYSVSEEHLVASVALARKYGVPLHTHLHECAEEIRASVELDRKSGFCHMCEHRVRPISNLERLGLLDGKTVLAHMTQLTKEEMELVSRRGSSVVHCPSSNLKLASGMCRVAALMAEGVNVCLGTDGAASNNSLDMLAEMKLAALLAKGVASDPTVVSATTALRMATINGAKALGLGDMTGSVEVGKRADLVAFELTATGCGPVFDPVSSLVYAAASRDAVSKVWVDGKLLVERGVVLRTPAGHGVDLDAWRERLRKVTAELAES